MHAQDEARTFGHDYVGTEHLLLGVLRDGEGVAARVLQENRIDLTGVLACLGETVGRGTAGPTRDLAFTPRGKEVVLRSVQEANALGHESIDTEHVLVALTRLEDGIAARIMVELGAQPSAIADEVIRAMELDAA